jgi:hypothetical protein
VTTAAILVPGGPGTEPVAALQWRLLLATQQELYHDPIINHISHPLITIKHH